MELISWRTQIRLVLASYAAVLLASAGLIFIRYLQYVHNAADAVASGGMWAGGDMILELFICCMFLVPTFFLLLVIAKSEAASTLYSKIALAFSLTAPLSVGLLFIPAVSQGWLIGGPCFFRVTASPVVLVAMIGSRIMVRFPRAKRLTSYALLVELATLVSIVVVLFLPRKTPLE